MMDELTLARLKYARVFIENARTIIGEVEVSFDIADPEDIVLPVCMVSSNLDYAFHNIEEIVSNIKQYDVEDKRDG